MSHKITQESEFSPKGSRLHGNLEGPSQYFYPDGTLASSCNYKGGKKEGKALYYDKSGRLVRQAFYIHDELDGEETFYNLDGSLATKLTWERGKLSHVCHFHPDGTLSREIELKKGKREGIDKKIDTDKTTRFEFEYRDGRLEKVIIDDARLPKNQNL
jgi:antitoxin component YwqK of YwqJK toxin-antitoxin module